MSPERHQRAVEILETKAGLEYSDDVERTREWADALAAADDEGIDAPPLIVNIEIPGFAPQNIRELVAGLADDLASRDGIAAAEVFLVRTCEICGCTDMEACLGGCWWTSPTDDICSTCAPRAAAPGDVR